MTRNYAKDARQYDKLLRFTNGHKHIRKVRFTAAWKQFCVDSFVSDIAAFVLKRDVKLQPTNRVDSLSDAIMIQTDDNSQRNCWQE